jgi:hypothetical protein
VVHLSTGLGHNPMEDFCKHCNESSGSIKGGKFINQLSDHQLVKKDSAS